MATSRESKAFAAPSPSQDAVSDLDHLQHNAKNTLADFTDRSVSGAVYRPRVIASGPDQSDIKDTLTLAWADSEERTHIIELSTREGRQTMNLRTRKGAEVVVLRRSDGRLVGWTGVDIKTDLVRPELFSQFVHPEFRGLGLGGLLEHFWWAYLDGHGYSTGFMRMELDRNQTLVERRLNSGYCRRATPDELGEQFITACRNCELFDNACHLRIFLAVDIKRALAARRCTGGPLNADSLPLRIALELKELD